MPLSRIDAMAPGRMSMEPLGARDAHKLPRITGSNPGSKNVSEGPNRDVSVATVGQSDTVAYIKNMGIMHLAHSQKAKGLGVKHGNLYRDSLCVRRSARASYPIYLMTN